ncbi:hypothetical protein E2C01_074925 [Portunus trituberculatus]|uniref:Uncharacterized protein n=1 Tax=Portunus trituberculatus TaxID=210409 RepID=A0A5B7IFJ6_PORTR|nr:hypothetical protein [Portunus trituberculatus]
MARVALQFVGASMSGVNWGQVVVRCELLPTHLDAVSIGVCLRWQSSSSTLLPTDGVAGLDLTQKSGRRRGKTRSVGRTISTPQPSASKA